MAANALIEAFAKGKKRFLTFAEIESYGSQVIEILKENGESAILILSRENTEAFFRGYVALDVLLAFCNERSVRALGI